MTKHDSMVNDETCHHDVPEESYEDKIKRMMDMADKINNGTSKPTRQQYLVSCLAEEASEIAQQAMKAARFGLEDAPEWIEPEHFENNARKILKEYMDLNVIITMMVQEGFLPAPDMDSEISKQHIEDKVNRVNTYYAYTRQKEDWK